MGGEFTGEGEAMYGDKSKGRGESVKFPESDGRKIRLVRRHNEA